MGTGRESDLTLTAAATDDTQQSRQSGDSLAHRGTRASRASRARLLLWRRNASRIAAKRCCSSGRAIVGRLRAQAAAGGPGGLLAVFRQSRHVVGIRAPGSGWTGVSWPAEPGTFAATPIAACICFKRIRTSRGWRASPNFSIVGAGPPSGRFAPARARALSDVSGRTGVGLGPTGVGNENPGPAEPATSTRGPRTSAPDTPSTQ